MMPQFMTQLLRIDSNFMHGQQRSERARTTIDA